MAPDGTVSLNRLINTFPKSTVPYPGREHGDPYPGGLALSADGTRLYVVLSRNNSVAVVDLGTDTVVAEIPVGQVPHSVVVAGDRAYVSNQGGRRPSASDFTNDSSGTPIVANRRSGHAITGTVSVVDLQTDQEILSIEVGLHPTALALDDSQLFVANSNSDSVSVIDVDQDRTVRTIAVDPFQGALLGSSPNALVVHDGHLVVSLGRANAVAVFRLGPHRFGGASLAGLIPTGWYPNALAVDVAGGGRLIVANGKGVGSLGPEATVGPDPATNKTGRWVHSNQGSASRIEATDLRNLGRFTRQVFANNGWDGLPSGHSYVKGEDGRSWRIASSRREKPVPLPERLGR